MSDEYRATAAEVVGELYRLLGAHDAAGVKALVNERFAEDATLTLPPALPYGGTISGRRALAGAFAASAAPAPVMGPKELTVAGVYGDDNVVVAEVHFQWASGTNAGEHSRALEKWMFTDGQVVAVDAFYLDPTAAR